MNKKNNRVTLLTMTALLLATLSALKADNFSIQEEQQKLSSRVFNHYDEDKSQALSVEEFALFTKDMKRKELEKRVEMILKSCDKNQDGKVELSEIPTEEELMKFFENVSFKMRRAMCHFREVEFKQVDKNEDNVSTKEELMLFHSQPIYARPKMIQQPSKAFMEKRALEGFKKQLKRCDKNGDKNITLVELTSERCMSTSDVFLQYSSDPKGSFEMEKIDKAPRYGMEDYFLGMIRRCDRDKDSKLDLVEATSQECHLSSDEFSRIDQDKDGFLVNAELEKKSKAGVTTLTPFQMDSRMEHMPPQIQLRMAFSMCDRDKDQNFTMQEAKDCNLSMEKFKLFDSDKSNSIEFNDIEQIEMLEAFKMVDINDDKKIDFKEFSIRMGGRCQVF